MMEGFSYFFVLCLLWREMSKWKKKRNLKARVSIYHLSLIRNNKTAIFFLAVVVRRNIEFPWPYFLRENLFALFSGIASSLDTRVENYFPRNVHYDSFTIARLMAELKLFYRQSRIILPSSLNVILHFGKTLLSLKICKYCRALEVHFSFALLGWP